MWQQIEQWRRAERPWWWAYLFAVTITFIAAAVIAIGMTASLPVGLLLLLPVLLSTYVGGLWPGMVSAALATAAGPFELVLLAGKQGHPLGSITGWWFTYPPLSLAICIVLEALHRARRSSEANQKQLISTLANVSDAVITIDADGRIEYLNQTAMTLLRCTVLAAIGKPFESVVEIHDEQVTLRGDSLLERARGLGGTVHMDAEQILVRTDGTQVPIEATLAPVRADTGAFIKMVLTIRDCSEQRQTETLLRERLALQARFERIASVVPGAVFEYSVGADGRQELLYGNPYFNEMIGLDPRSLRHDARALRSLVHPDDAMRVRQTATMAALQLRAVDIELRLITPHRGVRWIVMSAMPSRSDDGGTVWHGVLVDITDRKQAEERLRASQMQLQAALDAGEMGMVSIDLSSGEVRMDEAARRLWHLDSIAVPLTIEHMLEVLHPEARQAALDEYQRLRTSGPQPYESAYHLRMPNGQESWLVCRGRAYLDEVSGRMMTVGVSVDTTQHRRALELRMHSQKLEALGVLAGGIAHDFNNLLLAILGNANLVLSELSQTDPQRVSVQEIEKAATRAADLVRRILSFSRVPELSQRQQALPLRPMLDDVLGLARAVLPASIAIATNIPEQLPSVLVDSTQLHQALLNLLTNAADAAAMDGGKVELNVAAVNVDAALQRRVPDLKQGLYVCMTVADNGIGMDSETLQRIFDPFFTTKSTGRGTGLGLAIVHGIMKTANGAVTVRSSLGKGASFSLYFPAQNSSPLPIEPAPKVQAAARPAHLLYVDDEEALVFLMTRTLQRMGHRITACTSPEQALKKILASDADFDLVVSDMSMPGMSGLELAQQVLAAKPQLPFILTSGYLDAADVERARAIGVRQMIMKPNTVDELGQVLSEILQGQAAASPEAAGPEAAVAHAAVQRSN